MKIMGSTIQTTRFRGQTFDEQYYLQKFSAEDRAKIQRNKAAYAETCANASPELIQALTRAIDLYGSPHIETASNAETRLMELDQRFWICGQFYENRLLESLLKHQRPVDHQLTF